MTINKSLSFIKLSRTLELDLSDSRMTHSNQFCVHSTQFIQKILLKRMIHPKFRPGCLTMISIEDQNYPLYKKSMIMVKCESQLSYTAVKKPN